MVPSARATSQVFSPSKMRFSSVRETIPVVECPYSMTELNEKVFTRGMKAGFGALALGVGVMFVSGKVLSPALAAGIALGIVIGLAGLVLIIWEGIRD